ncbi:MAG: hypothetical protein HYZ74_08210 [Elusimicrobia bacterium]|nr:hypothetical protein [Elusimicrobiota bacterium]
MNIPAKALAPFLSTALILAAPGPLAAMAAAPGLKTVPAGLFNTSIPVPSVINTPAAQFGASAAAAAPSFAPSLLAPFLDAPIPTPEVSRPRSPLSLIQSRDASISLAQKGTALNFLYENTGRFRPQALTVSALSAASANDSNPAPLMRSSPTRASVTRQAPGSPRRPRNSSEAGSAGVRVLAFLAGFATTATIGGLLAYRLHISSGWTATVTLIVAMLMFKSALTQAFWSSAPLESINRSRWRTIYFLTFSGMFVIGFSFGSLVGIK